MIPCSGYAVSPDGRTYALVTKDRQIVLWDAVAQRKRDVRIEYKKGIGPVAFSPDNRSLFAYCGDNKLHVWDVATSDERRRFTTGDEGDSYAIAVSPDGRWVAQAGRDREIRVYELATGREFRRIPTLFNFITPLAFSPDGRMLAAGGMYEPTIHLWEVATGQLRQQLIGHQGRLFALAFTADGRRLASGSADTTALIWDLTGGRAIRRQRPPSPSSEELNARWNDLASDDAQRAYRAIQTLAAMPEPVVTFLQKHLQPIPTPDGKRVALLIADLDRDPFAMREKATKELQLLGSAIEPDLRAALTESAPTEMRRRLEGLLAKLDREKRTPSAAQLQELRAIEVLERIGDVAARRLLEQLSRGAPAARPTREAAAAVTRLERRSTSP
jgi:hypothetical protein